VPGPTFEFDGLAPWRPDAGLIECEVGPWLLDLHNFAAFLGYTFRADGLLTLTWYHHQPSIGPPTPNLVLLDFVDVLDLRVEQAPDWDVRCSDDTHGWDFWPEEWWVGRTDVRRGRQRAVVHGERRAPSARPVRGAKDLRLEAAMCADSPRTIGMGG
jgi:hypothetical protein